MWYAQQFLRRRRRTAEGVYTNNEERFNSMHEATEGGEEGTVRYGGAADAEIAWEDLRGGSEGGGHGEVQWGWRCRNSMGGGYGGARGWRVR